MSFGQVALDAPGVQAGSSRGGSGGVAVRSVPVDRDRSGIRVRLPRERGRSEVRTAGAADRGDVLLVDAHDAPHQAGGRVDLRVARTDPIADFLVGR